MLNVSNELPPSYEFHTFCIERSSFGGIPTSYQNIFKNLASFVTANADCLFQIQHSRSTTLWNLRVRARGKIMYSYIFTISVIRIQILFLFNRPISTQEGCFGCIKRLHCTLYRPLLEGRRGGEFSAQFHGSLPARRASRLHLTLSLQLSLFALASQFIHF